MFGPGLPWPPPAPRPGCVEPVDMVPPPVEVSSRADSAGGSLAALDSAGGGPAPRRRRVLIAAAAVALPVLLLGVWGAAWAAAGSGIPKGTTVAGVPVGGLSVSAAEQRLVTELPRVLARTVVIRAGEQSFPVEVAAAGLRVDPRATLSRAGKRSLNPTVLIPSLFGADDRLDPVTVVDDEVLSRTVGRIVKAVNRPVVDGAITFVGGGATVRRAQIGRALDPAATKAALFEALRTGGSRIDVEVRRTRPRVGAGAVAVAMRDFARPATAAPVIVELAGLQVSLPPSRYTPHLSLTADRQGRLVPAVDTPAIAQDLANAHADRVVPPLDAGYTFVAGEPELVPGASGEGIDGASFAERFNVALLSPTNRTFVADVVPAEPKVSTELAASLGIVEKISTFRTNYPIVPYRVTNIGRAAELINESLVLPGETWSLNERLGRRTRENGFVKGFVINKGRFAEDLGGGVSQSATTVFNAMFFAGLEDVEHHAHTLYISRYPAGREATVAFGSKDLRFRNNAPTGVLIQATHEPGHIRVTLWGTKQWDRIESVSSGRYHLRKPRTVISRDPKCVPTPPSSGFDIDVTRVYYKDGAEVRRERFHTRYAATDRVRCLGRRG